MAEYVIIQGDDDDLTHVVRVPGQMTASALADLANEAGYACSASVVMGGLTVAEIKRRAEAARRRRKLEQAFYLVARKEPVPGGVLITHFGRHADASRIIALRNEHVITWCRRRADDFSGSPWIWLCREVPAEFAENCHDLWRGIALSPEDAAVFDAELAA